MTLTRSIRTRTLVASFIGLIVASAVVAVVVLTSRPTSSVHTSKSLASSSSGSAMDHGAEDMGGMTDRDSADSPATSPTVEPSADHTHRSGNVPRMANHDAADVPANSPTIDPGHGHAGATADRPLAPVLGTFGGGASAVMLTAGFLRRRDKARATAKQAARAARKAQS